MTRHGAADAVLAVDGVLASTEIRLVEERICGTGAAEAMAITVADIAAAIHRRAGTGLAASRLVAVECSEAYAAVEIGAANAAKPDTTKGIAVP